MTAQGMHAQQGNQTYNKSIRSTLSPDTHCVRSPPHCRLLSLHLPASAGSQLAAAELICSDERRVISESVVQLSPAALAATSLAAAMLTVCCCCCCLLLLLFFSPPLPCLRIRSLVCRSQPSAEVGLLLLFEPSRLKQPDAANAPSTSSGGLCSASGQH
jgi:hypothetical protein